MKPEELADEIFLHLLPSYRTRPKEDRAAEVAGIAAEIRAAVEEATSGKSFKELCERTLPEIKAKAKAEAYEDAAKIAEDEPCTHCDVCPGMIGRMIRARAAEVGRDLA